MSELLNQVMSACCEKVNVRLETILDGYFKDPLYREEMRAVLDAAAYSLTAGGKRLRPFLVLQFCKLCGGKEKDAIDFACAVEMIHTYSLIHDDLPVMDNDDLRRGKPTNHKVYGEATALLAGDALLTNAFEVVSCAPVSPEQRVRAVRVLSTRAGLLGMIGGQEIDLKSEGRPITLETLRALQTRKTGMLIEAAALLGCIAAGCEEDSEPYKAASDYASALGLAFQITDDILDVVGDTGELGKTAGSDEKEHKATFVTCMGLENAKREASGQAALAIASLGAFGKRRSRVLADLADYILVRKN